MTDKDLLKRRIDTYNNLISRLDRMTSANYMHIVAGMRCTLKAMIDNNLAIIDSTQENPCEGCTNRKGCVTCENGELRETVQEEPVSEDLTQASEEYRNPWQTYAEDFDGELILTNEPCERAFIAGAQWQKEQFEKNRLKHCNSITNEQAELEQGFIDQHLNKYQRMPTFLDAIEYGMRLQQEQMMKDAKYGILENTDEYGVIKLTSTQIGQEKEGMEVKVIIIKED